MNDRVGDRVYEAYIGDMGEPLAITTRTRIHWISERVHGSTVLDVGCSQGILPIILAREGKTVDGLDIDAAAIDFANEKLSLEDATVRGRLRFIAADFFTEDRGSRYDTVVLSEIMEHLLFPEKALDRAIGLLNPGGRLLISVPFGINDAADHKHTYYGAKMIFFLSQRMVLSDRYVIRGGKGYWLCLSWDLPQDRMIIDYSGLLEQLEWIEQNVMERERDLSNQLAEALTKLRTTQTELQILNKKAGLDAVERATLTEKFSRSQADVIEAAKARNSMQVEFDERSKRFEDEISLARENIRQLNLEMTKMNTDLQKSEREAAIVQELRSEISRLTGDLEASETDYIRLCSKIEDIEGRYQTGYGIQIQLKGKIAGLEEKVDIISADLQRSHVLIEKQRAELDEMLSIINKLSDQLMNELKEEKRVLKEYSKLERERKNLQAKLSMFERSKTGMLVKKMWKVMNKIRGP